MTQNFGLLKNITTLAANFSDALPVMIQRAYHNQHVTYHTYPTVPVRAACSPGKAPVIHDMLNLDLKVLRLIFTYSWI